MSIYYGSDQVTTISFKVPDKLTGDLLEDAFGSGIRSREAVHHGELLKLLMIVGCPHDDLSSSQYLAWRAEFSTLKVDVDVVPLGRPGKPDKSPLVNEQPYSEASKSLLLEAAPSDGISGGGGGGGGGGRSGASTASGVGVAAAAAAAAASAASESKDDRRIDEDVLAYNSLLAATPSPPAPGPSSDPRVGLPLAQVAAGDLSLLHAAMTSPMDVSLAKLLAVDEPCSLHPFAINNSALRIESALSAVTTQQDLAVADHPGKTLPANHKSHSYARSYSIAYGPKTDLSLSSIPLVHAPNGDIVYLLSTYLGRLPLCDRIQISIHTSAITESSALDLNAMNQVTPREFLEVLAARNVPSHIPSMASVAAPPPHSQPPKPTASLYSHLPTKRHSGESKSQARHSTEGLLQRRSTLVQSEFKKPFQCQAEVSLKVIPPPKVVASARRVGQSIFLSVHAQNIHKSERICIQEIELCIGNSALQGRLADGASATASSGISKAFQTCLVGSTHFPLTLSPGERFTFVFRVDEVSKATLASPTTGAPLALSRAVLFLTWNSNDLNRYGQSVTCQYAIHGFSSSSAAEFFVSRCVKQESVFNELQSLTSSAQLWTTPALLRGNGASQFAGQCRVGRIVVLHTLNNLSAVPMDVTIELDSVRLLAESAFARRAALGDSGPDQQLGFGGRSASQILCLNSKVHVGEIAARSTRVVAVTYVAFSRGVFSLGTPKIFSHSHNKYVELDCMELQLVVNE